MLKKTKSKFDVIKYQDEWGALSQEAQDIIALKSKVDEISSVNLKLAKNLNDKAGGNQPGNGYPNAKGKKEDGKKNKNKKYTSKKRKQKEDEAWMKNHPKDGEPKVKTVNGKQWNWCIHHMAWGMHTP